MLLLIIISIAFSVSLESVIVPVFQEIYWHVAIRYRDEYLFWYKIVLLFSIA